MPSTDARCPSSFIRSMAPSLPAQPVVVRSHLAEHRPALLGLPHRAQRRDRQVGEEPVERGVRAVLRRERGGAGPRYARRAPTVAP